MIKRLSHGNSVFSLTLPIKLPFFKLMDFFKKNCLLVTDITY